MKPSRVLLWLLLSVARYATSASAFPLQPVAKPRKTHLAGPLNARKHPPTRSGPPVEGVESGYPGVKWGWDKPAPKASLVHLTPPQNGTATAGTLDVAEILHWFLMVPAALCSHQVLTDSKDWLGFIEMHGTGDSTVRLLLLVLAPILGFVGGIPAFVMHEYEGWQVAPFEEPSSKLVLTRNNNQWLREVAYKLLFVLQYVGNACFSLAILGFGPILQVGGFIEVPVLLTTCVLGFFIPYTDQTKKMTRYTSDGHSFFPVAWATALPFFVGATVNMCAYFTLCGKGDVAFWPVVPPIAFLCAGLFEGVKAETVFNQWWHIAAVVVFNVGMFVLLWVLQSFFGGAA